MSTIAERHAVWLRDQQKPMSATQQVTWLHRSTDLLSEAMSRLSMARDQLEHVARNWIAEPFPSITCGEADALYMAMFHVGLPDELGDEFMMHHAYTDSADDGDAHMVVVDETGTPVGWEQRSNIEDEELTPGEPAMFTVVAQLFYDPVTDSLATEEPS